MRKALTLFLLAFLLAAQPVRAQSADIPPSQQIPGLGEMTDPKEIMGAIDKAVDALWPSLIKSEQEYRDITKDKARFFQGQATHNKPPADGKAEYPDNWFASPSDQQYRWSDIGAFQFEPMPYAARIDVYSGPEGQGFVMCYWFLFKEELYTKCRNYGPEALRGKDWQITKAGAEGE